MAVRVWSVLWVWAGPAGWEEEVEAVGVRLGSVPVHHRLVQACHTMRPLYGPVVRLAVLWARHHLLDEHHLPLPIIELLAAWAFARPHPFQARRRRRDPPPSPPERAHGPPAEHPPTHPPTAVLTD